MKTYNYMIESTRLYYINSFNVTVKTDSLIFKIVKSKSDPVYGVSHPGIWISLLNVSLLVY